MRVELSHRSGESIDDFVADLTVGLGIGHLKAGSPCRGERVAKFNRLLDIKDEIKSEDGELYTMERILGSPTRCKAVEQALSRVKALSIHCFPSAFKLIRFQFCFRVPT